MVRSGRAEAHEYDLTVVLNAHREGALVQPTLRALMDAVDAAALAGISVEMVIALDRPDAATRDFLAARVPVVDGALPVRIIEMDNGDLSLSRNEAAEAAEGRVVAFCDADNLVSGNWFVEAVGLISANADDVIVHPEFVVSFGARDTIWRIRSSRDPRLDARAFAQFNFWDATCAVRRSTVLAHPYRRMRAGEGFGPEDWYWNLETLQAGIDHLVAPRTALFYRVKRQGSLLAEHQAAGALLPRIEFLASREAADRINARNEVDTSSAGSRPAGALSRARGRIVRTARRTAGGLYRLTVRTVGRGRRGRTLIHGLRRTLVDTYHEPTAAPQHWGGVPDWLLETWRGMQRYEPGLFPSRLRLERIGFADPVSTRLVDVYWDLLTRLGTGVDHLIVVPWLRTGGADKVVLHYARAALEIEPDADVVVLGTEPGPSPWAAFLPPSVRFVQVPDDFHRLPSWEQEQVLGTALVQTAPTGVHLVNSNTGYRTFARFPRALSATSRLHLSFFCVDRTAEGELSHWLTADFRSYADSLSGVLTDNADIVDWFVETYGVSRALFSVHYQPVPALPGARPARPRAIGAGERLQVLWAARFDRQKRVDIVHRVADAAARAGLPVDFHVYGTAVLSESRGIEHDGTAGSITLHGAFDGGLATLPADQFSVYLMTSEWEGLPNTLLEAGTIGFSVIAPDVGGVRELVSERTGYLVGTYDDVDGYIEQLRRILDDQAEAARRAEQLATLIAERHSWGAFVDDVRNTAGYLPAGGAL